MSTYTKIDSYTATGTVANIEFTNIPQTYTDLVLKWSTRTPNTTPTADNILFYFNNSINGNNLVLVGTGSGSPSSYVDTGTYASAGTVGSAASANTYSNGELYISNYTSSLIKSMSVDTVTENNGTVAWASLTAMKTAATDPITAIKLVPNFANFSIYSSATLYGIKKN